MYVDGDNILVELNPKFDVHNRFLCGVTVAFMCYAEMLNYV